MQNDSLPAVAVGPHQPEGGDETIWIVLTWSVEVFSVKKRSRVETLARELMVHFCTTAFWKLIPREAINATLLPHRQSYLRMNAH